VGRCNPWVCWSMVVGADRIGCWQQRVDVGDIKCHTRPEYVVIIDVNILIFYCAKKLCSDIAVNFLNDELQYAGSD